MTAIDWQDLVALSAVALAAGYLARLGIGTVSKRPGKGGGRGSGCGSCPSGPAPSSNGTGGPLSSIGPPRTPPKRKQS